MLNIKFDADKFRKMGYSEEKIEEFRKYNEAKEKQTIMDKYNKNIEEIKSTLANKEKLLFKVITESFDYGAPFADEIFDSSDNGYKKWLAFVIGLNNMAINDFRLESFLVSKFPRNGSQYFDCKRKIVDFDILDDDVKIMIEKDKNKLIDFYTGFIKKRTKQIINVLKYASSNGIEWRSLSELDEMFWAKYGY